MELRHYLRAIRRHWWIVLGVTVVTVLGLSFFAPGTTTYETSGTYVVRPRSDQAGETVRATEALNRSVGINATYARIARSDAVKDRALEQLRLSGISTAGLGVRSNVVSGTNILEIGASGSNPESVAAYAKAVGEEAAAYLDQLGEVYLLQLLDPPGKPEVVASNGTLTLVVGVTFGILAGAVLAFGLEYLREPAAPSSQGIWDRLTGLYSDEYFLSRLHQELGRCDVPADLSSRDSSDPGSPRAQLFTVGLLSLSSSNGLGPNAAPLPLERRDAAQALLGRLRPQDVLAYVGDDTFAVLFPDLPADDAEKILVAWRDWLASTIVGSPASLEASVQTCECNADGLAGHEEIVRLACAS